MGFYPNQQKTSGIRRQLGIGGHITWPISLCVLVACQTNSIVYGAGWLECDCARVAGPNVRSQTALNASVLANATSTQHHVLACRRYHLRTLVNVRMEVVFFRCFSLLSRGRKDRGSKALGTHEIAFPQNQIVSHYEYFAYVSCGRHCSDDVGGADSVLIQVLDKLEATLGAAAARPAHVRQGVQLGRG